MSDLIKRETVLAFVRRCKDRLQGKGLTYEILVDYIEAIPSAERKGEWIDKGRNLWECSNCKMEIYSESEQDRSEFHKWCSRCGARMKGADDGTR